MVRLQSLGIRGRLVGSLVALLVVSLGALTLLVSGKTQNMSREEADRYTEQLAQAQTQTVQNLLGNGDVTARSVAASFRGLKTAGVTDRRS